MTLRLVRFRVLMAGLAAALLVVAGWGRAEEPAAAPPSPTVAASSVVDASTYRRKVMCGYQGWFRCPGDAAKQGWVHWSRNGRRVTPETLTFEMWPDMTEYGPDERFKADGFTYPDGSQAELFSSDHPQTVRRHFEWMRDYGIDGAWLQHFVVDLPGGPIQQRYESRRRVVEHVRAAAKDTGRVWAICFDMAGTPGDKIYDVLTTEWKKLVDEGVTKDDRYLKEGGKPVVKVWGFYKPGQNAGIHLTAETARKLIEFFHAEGPYQSFLVGGGDWGWRKNADDEWRAIYHSFDAFCPWNVGNYVKDRSGVKHASTDQWAKDIAELKQHGVEWVPVVYPGFRWDNLQGLPTGTSELSRRGGDFLWEQIHAAAELKCDTLYVAMFDEVDEGTAVFKVTNTPPTQATFLGLEGKPSDWYLRLLGEGGKMIRGEREVTKTIPIEP